MKKQVVIVLLTAMMATMLAGCGSSESAAPAAGTEETTEQAEAADTDAAEEAQDTQEAATEPSEAEEFDEGFMPSDFIQEQAGVDTFDSYEDVLGYLNGENQGFAYISLDGSTPYVLAVTDTLYALDDTTMAASSVSLYAYNADGKLVNVGNAYSAGGEDDPVRCEDGTLYVCSADEYGEMKISQDTNGLFYTREISRYSETDGTVSFSGFVREDDDINSSSEDIGISTDEEFEALLTSGREKTPIRFWGAEYASYDDVIAQLPADYGYAYLTIDGYDGDVLAVTDFTYQWDNGENASLTAYLYVQNGDTVQYLGNVMTGGTGYPVRCANGILYNCNMVQYGEMKVEQKSDGKYGLTYTNRGTITNNADGTVEIETEGKLAGAEENEIRDKIAAMDGVAVVDFTVVK